MATTKTRPTQRTTALDPRVLDRDQKLNETRSRYMTMNREIVQREGQEKSTKPQSAIEKEALARLRGTAVEIPPSLADLHRESRVLHQMIGILEDESRVVRNAVGNEIAEDFKDSHRTALEAFIRLQTESNEAYSALMMVVEESCRACSGNFLPQYILDPNALLRFTTLFQQLKDTSANYVSGKTPN